MAKVEPRELIVENWETCLRMELAEEQRAFVESNAWSVAESRFHPWMLPLAIYDAATDRMVGFVMYSDERDPRVPNYSVHRLMVDQTFQHRGFGHAAMHEVIRRIVAKPDGDELWIGYHPAYEIARRFYASLGFEECGEAPWGGDLVARLALGRDSLCPELPWKDRR